jgi:hypothetical protein
MNSELEQANSVIGKQEEGKVGKGEHFGTPTVFYEVV